MIYKKYNLKEVKIWYLGILKITEKILVIDWNGNISSLSENGFINKGFINGIVLLTNKNSKELVEIYKWSFINKWSDFGNKLWSYTKT